MEHNPYIELNDCTTITYSDIKLDEFEREYITVYFETPTLEGFNSMEIRYPHGTPEKIVGYTDTEVNALLEHYKKVSPLAFEFAKEGEQFSNIKQGFKEIRKA